MSKFSRIGVLAIVLTVAFGTFGVAETKAQGVLNEILKRMDNNNRLLKSLQANIKMDKYNPQLDDHDVSEGTMKYLPGANEKQMYVRIDWAKPTEEKLAVVKGEYVLYTPRLKRAIVGKVDKAQGNAKANGALAFMSMSKAQLKQNYMVKYIGEEKVGGSIPTWHLELIPKNATSYKSADIWIDGDGMPIQAKIVEKNNDTTTVLLSGLQKNVKLSGDVFKVDVPRDVKPIKG